MISPEVITWSSLLFVNIVSIAARALMLAAGAGIILTALRVKSTSLRLFTWTSVLYAVIAISVAGWMLPPIPVRLPVLTQTAEANNRSEAPLPTRITAIAGQVRDTSGHEPRPEVAYSTNERGTSASANASPSSTSSFPWSSVAGGVYLIIAALFVCRILVGWLFTLRLVRGSELIHENRVAELLALRTASLRLRKPPRVAESELISVPVTLGAVWTSVLLPESWRQWDEAKLDAVLSHELSHAGRRDPLTQLVSLLHRAVFWFSPLSWWLDRHLKDLAEQASDEAALISGANCNDYARALLDFFATLQSTPHRVWWQGVSIADASQAERRVERILAWRGAVSMTLKRSVAIIVIALAIPVAYLVASVGPAAPPRTVAAIRAQQPTAPPPSSATPASPSTTPAPASPARSAGAPVAAPAQPTEPATPASSQNDSHQRSYGFAYGYDDEQRFVIVPSNNDEFTMSGSSEDARHVERLRKQIPGAFIWFQRDERSYVIRDQATVERALKLWAPQRELGTKQEELGRKQEVLGKRQSELGAQMQSVRVKVPDMTAELEKLRTELASLSSGATADQVGKIQSEIGELQSRIGEVQSSAGEQQSKIGEQMSALGEKQSKLGEQQSELGQQQADLARKATREMRALLDEAIKNGTARREPETGDSGSI